MTQLWERWRKVDETSFGSQKDGFLKQLQLPLYLRKWGTFLFVFVFPNCVLFE
jgi:hypothetical protein